MDFTYIATGQINVGGCSDYLSQEILYWQFAVNSIVFSKPAALKGKYERIAIKEVIFNNIGNMCRGCNYRPIYKDSYNALWSEEELVAYSDAVEIVDNFYVVQAARIERNALKCL
jgi:hypothetical protein